MEKQLIILIVIKKTTLFCVTTQRVVVLSYRRPIGSRNVGNQVPLIANNLKEHTYLLRGGSLKSRILIVTLFLFKSHYI
jgi:hypothetical protein